MKLSKFRQSYIVDRAFILTLASTIFTALAPLVATMVDSLFCSHLLGRDAFIAVNVTLPVVNAVGVLTLICCRGGAVSSARRLAQGDKDSPQRIFTIALFSAVLVAVLAAISIWINMDAVASRLAGTPESVAYVEQYLSVIVLYFLILPFNNTLNDFATYEGYPQLVTRAVLAGCSANVLFDVLFIGPLHMGIIGAAWGTVASGLINLSLILPFYLRKKSQYRLRKPLHDTGAILWENIKQGFGFNVFYIVVNLFMMMCNALVLRVAGTEGLTLFGICLQIQSATFSVVVGLCIAGISHITYMRASGDIQGLLRIMHTARNAVVGFYGLQALLMIFFPQLFLWCFGFSDTVDLSLTRKVFTSYAIYYFCFCVVSVYVTVVLQLAGHVGAKIVLVFSLGIVSYLCMLALSFISPDAMWLGMVVGSVPILLASLGVGYWYHKKHPEYTKLSLVDRYPKKIEFDCSLDYDGRHIDDFKRDARLFADTCEMPEEVFDKICLAGKMLYKNAVEHKYKRSKYMDISLVELDDGFSLSVKDCGHPYNPVANGIDARTLGARSATYRFMFSVNITTFTWDKRLPSPC
ncbi:MAG: polysaccharide biosynthesis C-terminal domain-containing protein [Bacteroidales bacterium]|nr:polysaccharide biosynthesis C-terminal domain-containing protein [Bacteroidales bacterium]